MYGGCVPEVLAALLPTPKRTQPKRKWQSPNATHATETGYPGQLPADGGGGTSEGTPGSQIPGRAHSHRANPAASESSAVKLKSVGGGTD